MACRKSYSCHIFFFIDWFFSNFKFYFLGANSAKSNTCRGAEHPTNRSKHCSNYKVPVSEKYLRKYVIYTHTVIKRGGTRIMRCNDVFTKEVFNLTKTMSELMIVGSYCLEFLINHDKDDFFKTFINDKVPSFEYVFLYFTNNNTVKNKIPKNIQLLMDEFPIKLMKVNDVPLFDLTHRTDFFKELDKTFITFFQVNITTYVKKRILKLLIEPKK